MAARLVRWLVFGVLLAIVPLVINVIISGTRGAMSSSALQIICSRGELLLVCAGIAGAGIGEIVARGTNAAAVFKIIAVGGCVLMLFIGLAWYTAIVIYVEGNSNIDLHFVTDGSLVVFACTFLCAGGCVALSEI